VPVLAHGGELILNPRQQAAAGIDYDRLAAALSRQPIIVQIDGREVARATRSHNRQYDQSNLSNGVGRIG
jgi:hypothetical protein